MNVTQKVRDLLPLQSSSHRLVAAANGLPVFQVYSGGIGIVAANEIEVLLVKSVNSHEALVIAAGQFLGALGEMGELGPRMKAAAQATLDALALAGGK